MVAVTMVLFVFAKSLFSILKRPIEHENNRGFAGIFAFSERFDAKRYREGR